jgi:hypothetical protein
MQKIPQWDSRTDNSDNCDKLFEKDLVVTESGLLDRQVGLRKLTPYTVAWRSVQAASFSV